MSKTHFATTGARKYAMDLAFYHEPTAETTGNVFFVHSGTGTNSVGGGRTPDEPLAGVDYAIGLCTASNGDRIYVMPGHAESLATAGAIACDVAGVSIIGLGNGSNRPTFTWTATDSSWTISAANVTISNIRCTSSIDEMVSMFSVTAAGATLDRVDVFETASAQILQFLLSNASADNLEIGNCRHYQNSAGGSAQAWIKLVGADRCYIHDNIFVLTLNDAAASAVLNFATTACHDGVIARNFVRMTGYSANLVSAFLDSASSRLLVTDNRIATDTAVNTTINDCPSGWHFNNLCTNAVDKSGIVDPVVDI